VGGSRVNAFRADYPCTLFPEPAPALGGTFGEILAVETDHEILVSERFGVSGVFTNQIQELEPTGQLDTTFASAGTLSVVGTAHIQVDAGGNILVAAATGTGNFMLSRFNSQGNPDLTFGTNGSVTTQVATKAGPQNVLFAPNGDIIVSGFAVDNAGVSHLALVAYLCG
jgi:hypothetical protein